jgi:hypothetical protein
LDEGKPGRGNHREDRSGYTASILSIATRARDAILSSTVIRGDILSRERYILSRVVFFIFAQIARGERG